MTTNQIDLNAPIKGEASKFEGVLPKGEYTFEVVSVGTKNTDGSYTLWKAKVNPTIAIKSGGKPTGEVLTDYTTYSAEVRLKVINDQKYDGALVFHYVLLHPNVPYSFKNFVYACGFDTLQPMELTRTVGKQIVANVDIETVPTKVKDEYGMETIVHKEKNKIKNLIPLTTINQDFAPKLDINTDDLPF